jgi:hypothetical protein
MDAARTYETITYDKYLNEGKNLDGKAVAFDCYLTTEKNSFPYRFVKDSTARALEITPVQQHNGNLPAVYIRKNSSAESTFGIVAFGSDGVSAKRYTVKGVVKLDSTATATPKWTLIIDVLVRIDEDKKPADASTPADTKPADTKPADTKPDDSKPAETKKPDPAPDKTVYTCPKCGGSFEASGKCPKCGGALFEKD